MTPEKAKDEYWGPTPLPKGSKSIGIYKDERKTGCLIELENGLKVCGNSGVIRNINIKYNPKLF